MFISNSGSLANQFRALEEDEIMFLDSIRERQEQEERQRKEKDGEEVKGFKECVQITFRSSTSDNRLLTGLLRHEITLPITLHLLSQAR